MIGLFQVVFPALDQLLDLRFERLAVGPAHLVGRSREIDDPQLRCRSGKGLGRGPRGIQLGCEEEEQKDEPICRNPADGFYRRSSFRN
jgi:hypothetical protein